MLAPLMAGACNKDPEPPIVPNGGLDIVDCADGQLLGPGTTNVGDQVKQGTCVGAPSANLKAPPCGANQALNSNGTSLSCVDKGSGMTDQTTADLIKLLDMKTTTLKTTVNGLSAGGGASATFVGVTKIASKGNFIAPVGVTADRGFHAGAALCSVDYPGSRLCSVYDIYNSITTGKLRLVADPNAIATKVTSSWIYMPAWGNPVASTFEPNDGVSDDCGNGTYDTGDKAWKGIAMAWNVDAMSNGAFGLKLLGGAQTSCATALPLACCK